MSWDLAEVYAQVAAAAPRVAALGGWPGSIAPESLLERLPQPGRYAGGFDAGVACALDLIPPARQRLAARLHAAYSPAAVEQVRSEAERLDPDSETCWWLAACAICDEDNVDQRRLVEQLDEFLVLAGDHEARLQAAARCLEEMRSTFRLRDGVPYGEVDGCMQGAYLAGHPLATMRAQAPGEAPLYYLGTYLDSLGLEGFAWSGAQDADGRPRSGPVHGSRQFATCHDEAELDRALAVARRQLGV